MAQGKRIELNKVQRKSLEVNNMWLTFNTKNYELRVPRKFLLRLMREQEATEGAILEMDGRKHGG